MITKTCLVGPDEIFRVGLAHVLQNEGFEIAGSFGSPADVEASGLDPEFLAIVDLPGEEDQADTVAAFKSLNPGCQVVVLAQEFSFESMVMCFDRGASSYILRSLNLPALIAALRLTALGERVMPSNLASELRTSSMASRSIAAAGAAITGEALTQRQCEVLGELVEGNPNKVIARKLDMCEATVKVHVKAILRKLRVRNRTQAALWAAAHEMTGPARQPTLVELQGSRPGFSHAPGEAAL